MTSWEGPGGPGREPVRRGAAGTLAAILCPWLAPGRRGHHRRAVRRGNRGRPVTRTGPSRGFGRNPELEAAMLAWLAAHSADARPEPERSEPQALFPAEGEAECAP